MRRSLFYCSEEDNKTLKAVTNASLAAPHQTHRPSGHLRVIVRLSIMLRQVRARVRLRVSLSLSLSLRQRLYHLIRLRVCPQMALVLACTTCSEPKKTTAPILTMRSSTICRLLMLCHLRRLRLRALRHQPLPRRALLIVLKRLQSRKARSSVPPVHRS